MEKSSTAQKNFQIGTSRAPRSGHTLALQMAKAISKEEREQRRAIGERLKDLRGRRPQPAIADAIGVTLRAYHAWEAGESGIAWRNLHALAEYHSVNENFILYGDEKPRGAGSQLDRIEERLARIEEALGATSTAAGGAPARPSVGLQRLADHASNRATEVRSRSQQAKRAPRDTGQ
jgi:transcriptional regulator with XRE-family HTH domain